MKSSKHLVFLLGDNRFAVPLRYVKEVIAMQKLTPMPKSPPFLQGLINVRGSIIQVFDLVERLKLPKPSSKSEKPSIIISEIGDLVIGATVDEVLEVKVIADSQIGDPGDLDCPAGRDYISGIARAEQGPITLILNLELVLNVRAA